MGGRGLNGTGEHSCGLGYADVLCARCDIMYFRDSVTQRCVSCDAGTEAPSTIILCVLSAVVLAFFAVYVVAPACSRYWSTPGSGNAGEDDEELRPGESRWKRRMDVVKDNVTILYVSLTTDS